MRRMLQRVLQRLRSVGEGLIERLAAGRVLLILIAIASAAGYALYAHPPVVTAGRGEVGVRANRLTGDVTEWRDGGALVLPGLHLARLFSVRDRIYRPVDSVRADGPAPFQSVEGLSIGIDLTVRYALDPQRLRALWNTLPEDLAGSIVEPAVQGVIYKVFARYTVREIFSTKRAEIQRAIEDELGPRLARDGVVLRNVLVGRVDLPSDYRRGMEALLAEELASEKMRYTLELKDKRVKETELEAQADKVRRELRAEAAAREQVIAARAQEEAMQHVLPFKQRQVEQRKLEAEAERVAHVRRAEGSAEARRIEAQGEADARQRLAEAEAYRLEQIGKANAEQMSREGALLTRHPLLVQKALVDKLSDKIQVIVAPPPADGGFIGSRLLGGK
ncbi:MAG TPA: SPFH domain-containing protein [Burkholderiales bacterium]|nr:SPFH domain-containing protein [Burkholderiales bacterium]